MTAAAMASSSPRWRTRRMLRPCARTMASASRVESRSSHNVDGQAHHPLGDAGKILRAARLPTLRAVGVQRQADHHLRDAFALRELDQRVEHGRQAVARGRARATGVASRRSSSLSATPTRRSPASMPSTRPWRTGGYLGPWTLTSIRNARGAHVGVMSTLGASARPLSRAR